MIQAPNLGLREHTVLADLRPLWHKGSSRIYIRAISGTASFHSWSLRIVRRRTLHPYSPGPSRGQLHFGVDCSGSMWALAIRIGFCILQQKYSGTICVAPGLGNIGQGS